MTIHVGIAGITGRFARLLAGHLLKHSDVNIRGYCRNAKKAPIYLRSNSKVSIQEGAALEKDKIRTFVSGLDIVICCYQGDDTLMIEGQKALIDACESQNVSRYIASDWSLDYTKLELGQLFVQDPMKHVKSYLDSTERVQGVHILVGGFMEPIFSPLFGILDPQTATFRYWGEGDELWEGITYNDAAKFTAALARDTTAVGIQRFIGDRSSIRDIAESFEKVYNVKPTLVKLGSIEDLYNRMHLVYEKEPANIFKYMPLFFMYYYINGQARVGPEIDNSRYSDVEPLTWEGFLRSHSLDQLPVTFANLFLK